MPVWWSKERLSLSRTKIWRRPWAKVLCVRVITWLKSSRHSWLKVWMHWRRSIWRSEWWPHSMHKPVWIHIAIIETGLSQNDNLGCNWYWLPISTPVSTSTPASRPSTPWRKNRTSCSTPRSSSRFQTVHFPFWLNIIWQFLWRWGTRWTSYRRPSRTFWASCPFKTFWTIAGAPRTSRWDWLPISGNTRTWWPMNGRIITWSASSAIGMWWWIARTPSAWTSWTYRAISFTSSGTPFINEFLLNERYFRKY